MTTAGPLDRHRERVRPEWIDYNGHMTDAHYLTAFGWTTDALYRYVGVDETYREAGRSFYTVESHVNYFREAKVGDALHFTTQVLGVDEKRLHYFHHMYRGDELLATNEQMLLHVDTKAAKACAMPTHVRAALDAITAAHAELATPAQVGHRMSLTGQ